MTQTLDHIASHYQRHEDPAKRDALRELLIDSLPPLAKSIYEHAAANKAITTNDVVRLFGRSSQEAGNILGALHTWGLLWREKQGKGRTFVYRVSE